MHQTISWAFVVAGLGLFFYQGGELIAKHSTWAEVAAPAGIGELFKAAGGACLAVMGAFGVKFNGKKEE